VAAAIGTHQFTVAEWDVCEKLGYQSYPVGTLASLVDYINTNFPGLDLLTWLTEIDNLLKGMTDKPVFKVIGFDDRAQLKLFIQYYSEDSDDDTHGLAFQRTIIKDKDHKTAVHDFFRIPLTSRMQGNGRKMLAIGLQQYLNVGVDVIKVHAALADGGYVWAKAHFTAVDPTEMGVILVEAKHKLGDEQFRTVKAVFDNYYAMHPDGKAFPINKWSNLPGMETILRNSHWHGEIDLNNKELLAKFKNYVAGK
jgi:hypothetical protein